MNSDGFVALTKCYFCNKDHQVLLSTRPHTFNRKVAEAHGKVIDMSPCNECEAFMKRGIILITIDHAKSEQDWNKERMSNPYRTGGWFVITEDAFKRIFMDTPENTGGCSSRTRRLVRLAWQAPTEGGKS